MTDVNEVENKKKTLSYMIRTVNILIKRNIENSELKKQFDNATGMHGYVIAYLNECERKIEDVFQRDVEKRFSIRRSTATAILQLMEKRGFITRESVECDARLKKIVLTKKAKSLCELFERERCEFEKSLSEGLTEDEINTAIKLLSRIADNLTERLEKTDLMTERCKCAIASTASETRDNVK